MFDTRNRALALTIARRTVSTLITLLGVAIIVFVILRLLPGDAITGSLGVNAGLLSPAQHEALVHLDRKSTRLNSSHFVPSRMPSSA